MESVYSLLQDHWRAFDASSGFGSSPSLVLNFLGGDDLSDGGDAGERLRAAAEQLGGMWGSVGAVVITRGIDQGITKHMTDAFADGAKVSST